MTRASRDQFPIFAAQVRRFHYLDNAATGQICRAAAEALWRFETSAAPTSSAASTGWPMPQPRRSPQARAEVAAYIGAADPDEVVFTSGTTLATQHRSPTPWRSRLGRATRSWSRELEHHSNIVPWQMPPQRTAPTSERSR